MLQPSPAQTTLSSYGGSSGEIPGQSMTSPTDLKASPGNVSCPNSHDVGGCRMQGQVLCSWQGQHRLWGTNLWGKLSGLSWSSGPASACLSDTIPPSKSTGDPRPRLTHTHFAEAGVSVAQSRSSTHRHREMKLRSQKRCSRVHVLLRCTSPSSPQLPSRRNQI